MPQTFVFLLIFWEGPDTARKKNTGRPLIISDLSARVLNGPLEAEAGEPGGRRDPHVLPLGYRATVRFAAPGL